MAYYHSEDLSPGGGGQPLQLQRQPPHAQPHPPTRRSGEDPARLVRARAAGPDRVGGMGDGGGGSLAILSRRGKRNLGSVLGRLDEGDEGHDRPAAPPSPPFDERAEGFPYIARPVPPPPPLIASVILDGSPPSNIISSDPAGPMAIFKPRRLTSEDLSSLHSICKTGNDCTISFFDGEVLVKPDENELKDFNSTTTTGPTSKKQKRRATITHNFSAIKEVDDAILSKKCESGGPFLTLVDIVKAKHIDIKECGADFRRLMSLAVSLKGWDRTPAAVRYRVKCDAKSAEISVVGYTTLLLGDVMSLHYLHQDLFQHDVSVDLTEKAVKVLISFGG